MDLDFKDVLYLFSCGANGIMPTVTHKMNIENIYIISCKQGIWGVVFLAIKKLNETNQIEIDSRLFDAWEKQFFSAAISQIQKREIISNVLGKLRENSIPAYVLKGDIVAQYYKEPLSRPSSDTDIYVGENALAESEKVFAKCGFEVKARSPMEHHTVCNHKTGGSVDLHLTFHDDCFEEKYFFGYTNITETGVEYKIEDYTFLSLGVTDNLIFLFLHLVKHFLSCGAGIRQLMDFLLFWKNNRTTINIPYFKKMLFDLGFEKLFASYIQIGIEYLNFDKKDFTEFDYKVDELFTQWLLMDIENGGVFGKLEQRKLTFFYLFGENNINANQKSFTKYFSLYANTFKYDFLSKKYKYLEKSKFLLPAAYLQRTYDLVASAIRVMKTAKKAKTQNEEIKNIKSRMDIISTIYKK